MTIAANMRVALVVTSFSITACLGNGYVACGDNVCPANDVCAPAGCATVEELAACANHDEGAACTFSGFDGTCHDGLCLPLACGNGVVQGTEECDDGLANSNAPDAHCRPGCILRACGDGIVDTAAGEVCDDGNVVDGDGCSADCMSTPVCTLASMTFMSSFSGSTSELAVPQDASFGIVTMGGSVYARLSLASSTTTGPIVSGTWTHPALVPDGSRLFLAQSGAIQSALRNGTDSSSWSAPSMTDVPGGNSPGTPSIDPGGELRMIVQTAADFQEYVHSASGWTAGKLYTPAVIGPGGNIGYPALTIDGRLLVYVVSGTASDNGIWGVNRDSITQDFTSSRAVKLVAAAAGGAFASPYLTPDCSHLYAVDIVSTSIVVYHR